VSEIDEIIARKQALRREMKARRAAISAVGRMHAAAALRDCLLPFFEARPERTVGVYLSLPYEISLDPLISSLIERGITVAAPRVDTARDEMSFWKLESLDATEIGPWQVRQPLGKQRIDELSLILVPGLAFDPNGGRLGMGGGWYDRVLGKAGGVVGVAFDCQIMPEVPLEAHDIRVGYVATEKQWFEPFL
jgi:5-formyltetrahydrofolate cyclo-ligase